tara:strand:- start:799 stop:975 length:177 start_codon:yes stop_codon:yes gene_type:complete
MHLKLLQAYLDEECEQEAIFLFLDLEKAFDRVRRRSHLTTLITSTRALWKGQRTRTWR